ncbi:Bifunctional protein HldE (Includes: D-beta-D-heptose 7-phosphate kinase; D-beta-D-heptose 1-phosphate adenylyltransferase) [Candidatus Terasakiella magnetica]|uniref:Bifunctional protein HldE n=1 Tax=Candidatus Terasakiella magnetica TaxID=1867952 RepID=A0A1C3RGR5_9PROT|nr:bifunctional D-glycero-beta-D-manno-heptose-7-phosphate kinase/D-glycero-beta-D-manno-heptose 1-phosphate adenylyltransferase HldE [Candidatus Terasakiella magnetica]SCA56382.1 Bifunctional protein HldE (Includes: D-beta-D-heptose 7-phosphate kinase; D-beta-D-heptose 1-phosphate adenylyltransferase) [Candidatus Terasakiella magnetica]
MSQHAHLIDLVSSEKSVEILCVGDIMLDRFVYGSVERISPEAPIPVLKIEREDAMLGGAGNVVRNLLSLGAEARFCGLVGEDEAGRTIAGLLNEDDHCCANLLLDKNRPTSMKTRFMASNQQMLRTDHETVAPLSQNLQDDLLLDVAESLGNAKVMVLSDYGKGVLESETPTHLINLAKKAGIPVIVDPKGIDYSKYRGATLVTPNRKELSEASRMKCGDDASIVAAARHIIETCGIENVLATRSQDGMTLVTRGGDVVHLPTQAREVFDVSGAGDTVVASLALALAHGASLSDGAKLANVAAGIVVAKIGTASVYSEELIEALHHQDLSQAEAKIVQKAPAKDRITRWQTQGKTVGFTNGCFDLLHPGHISLLKQSASQCDKLIVGLNSDASVKRLKGDERPLQNEMARATVLSSLACVDMVVIFDEDTPLELLSHLLPDVLVKGADYTIDQVVGADLIQQNGGRVFLANLEDGFSTTNTVNKLKKS